jgi:hypothetical protein
MGEEFTEEAKDQPIPPGRLWFVVGAGPIIYAAHLVIAYAIQTLSCQWNFLRFYILGIHGIRLTLLVITLVAAAAILYAAFLGYNDWLAWRRFKDGKTLKPEQHTRYAFMSYSGLIMALFFAAVVLLSLAPSLALGVCD